jgi:hypothetical protein
MLHNPVELGPLANLVDLVAGEILLDELRGPRLAPGLGGFECSSNPTVLETFAADCTASTLTVWHIDIMLAAGAALIHMPIKEAPKLGAAFAT